MTQLKAHFVWDATVRWFHWINLLCVLGLIGVGVVILNAKSLGVSTDGKILLKTIHVWFGYVFALNLFWRLIWAFVGGSFSRWAAILPGRRNYWREVSAYITSLRAGSPRQYLGHNPLGRIAVTSLLLLLFAQAVTGLVLAGTDLFYPPLGSWIAGWIAATGVDSTTLAPYAPGMYDETNYEAMRAFRKPFITVHYYNFYVLIAFAVIHILAVVATELREGGSLVSAMFSGKKVLSGTPEDLKKPN
jgi:Ni/Fe-hydrogenase 1 B-type cytochrome subunit